MLEEFNNIALPHKLTSTSGFATAIDIEKNNEKLESL
jgi:hypothetical protein